MKKEHSPLYILLSVIVVCFTVIYIDGKHTAATVVYVPDKHVQDSLQLIVNADKIRFDSLQAARDKNNSEKIPFHAKTFKAVTNSNKSLLRHFTDSLLSK